ncbi:MAG: universal stress protein [Oceanicoccus sp.]|uniref:universal stress protein n=1 Tax=Oceanicoccus sp. TaxID=2691044 RepID=UPI0026390A00|nr:universal stress protein [Oceanicoccus sp.]MCP3907701.1 universal stress protein [Oceanicoccus sp.]MDG1773734.1 universal stress protein [Oceanicoccus sp.]
MSNYQTILLATDLSDEGEQVAQKAAAIATAENAALHMIHVIEPLSFAYGGDIPMDFSGIQDEIQSQAEAQIAEFAAKYALPKENQHIVIGRAENEIHSLAEALNADLVVVGSHGRHGIALLLGSTANGVLHGATCDVLAVRVGES